MWLHPVSPACDTSHRNMYLPDFLCRNDLCKYASVWWEHVQSACFYLCVYRFSFRPILTVWAFCCFFIILQTAGQGRRLAVIDLSSFGREKMEWSTCCFGTNPRRFSVPNCQLPKLPGAWVPTHESTTRTADANLSGAPCGSKIPKGQRISHFWSSTSISIRGLVFWTGFIPIFSCFKHNLLSYIFSWICGWFHHFTNLNSSPKASNLPLAYFEVHLTKITQRVREIEYSNLYLCTHAYIQTYRHTDRHTDIQTYRHTDIQTYRHTDIHTYIHTLLYFTLLYLLYLLTLLTYFTLLTYLLTYLFTYLLTYLLMYVRTYKHTNIQTYVYTYITYIYSYIVT